MVSIFEGRLTRTWYYNTGDRKHVLTLFHDTITGVRSAMVDYEEVPGSLDNSSMFMEASGHRIFFNVGRGEAEEPGYFHIGKSGWTGFTYHCVVNDVNLVETTMEVATHAEIVFEAKIVETAFTPDEFTPSEQIAWYVVRATRTEDKVETSVHRRFSDFVELNSQVKQNFKGNHLRASIPPFPEKTLKLTTDHRDPSFIQERSSKLERYLSTLLCVPHVCDMTCVKSFLGLMDKVREMSIVFYVPTLGMALIPSERSGTPAIVGGIQRPEACGEVMSGDFISKINGSSVSDMLFNGVVTRLKMLPRPMVVHFVQTMAAVSDSSAPSKTLKTPMDMPSEKPAVFTTKSPPKKQTVTATNPSVFSADSGETTTKPLPASLAPFPISKKVSSAFADPDEEESKPLTREAVSPVKPVVQKTAPVPEPVAEAEPVAEEPVVESEPIVSEESTEAVADVEDPVVEEEPKVVALAGWD